LKKSVGRVGAVVPSKYNDFREVSEDSGQGSAWIGANFVYSSCIGGSGSFQDIPRKQIARVYQLIFSIVFVDRGVVRSSKDPHLLSHSCRAEKRKHSARCSLQQQSPCPSRWIDIPERVRLAHEQKERSSIAVKRRE
jgi:hypothetical protein